jgi:hypothetical protein
MQESNHYHDTTPLSPANLPAAVAAAKSQDEAVKLIFEHDTESRSLTPSRVYIKGMAMGRKWLLTSVRRAMCNLSFGDKPFLVKTGNTEPGPYGRPENTWRRANTPGIAYREFITRADAERLYPRDDET